MKKLFLLLFVVVACGVVKKAPETRDPINITSLCDKVWTFSQTQPAGFTLDIRSMIPPGEGISVAYATTQNSHSRDALPAVVFHALSHSGYVGGWLDTTDSLYYFDSIRIFPPDSLAAAMDFGRANDQIAIFNLSTGAEIRLAVP